MGNTELRGNLCGPATEAQVGAPTRFADHLDLKPIHSAADSGAECLGSRFLCGKPCRQTLGSISFAHAVGLLRRRENAIKKPLAKALERLLDACYFNQVNAAADNHAVYQPNTRRRRLSRTAGKGAGDGPGFAHLYA